MKKTYKVEVDCANCAAKIEDAICHLDGVKNARVNFMTQKMTLESDDADLSSLVRAAEKAGKKVDSDFEIEY